MSDDRTTMCAEKSSSYAIGNDASHIKAAKMARRQSSGRPSSKTDDHPLPPARSSTEAPPCVEHPPPPRAYTPVHVLGRGTYGTVYKGYDEHGVPVALKIIRFIEESDGVPSTVLREISLLKELSHPNIIHLLRIIPSPQSLVLVFELADCDLKRFQDLYMQPLSPRRVKSFMYQLLSALAHIHSFKVLHRDLKPQNLLLRETSVLRGHSPFQCANSLMKLSPYGTARRMSCWEIKIIQLGLICGVSGAFSQRPLFAGGTTEEHLAKIFEALGTPAEDEFPNSERYVDFKVRDVFRVVTGVMQLLKRMPRVPKRDLAVLVPHADLDALDLLRRLLVYNGEQRISATAALQHPYFTRTKFEQRVPLRLDILYSRKLQSVAHTVPTHAPQAVAPTQEEAAPSKTCG